MQEHTIPEAITDLAAAIRDGRLSPVEVVERALERIDRWQPRVNAFSQVRPEEAVEEARARADELARDGPRGPLHGVPVAVKDLFDVRGWETSGGSQAYRGNMAGEDADAVRALREAGAVVVGKTNMHELAAGGTNTVSVFGAARNPWDPSRMTGGSSGGSAAAVATRCVPLALGTDTGGSIRIPSSFCGITGLKPGYGRVSMGGALPLAPSMDTAGPMAVSAADAAVAFAVLSGDRGAMPPEGGPGAEGLRVGLAGGFFAERVHPEVLRATEEAAGVLEGSGATVRTADPGPLHDAPETWVVIAWSEFAVAHGHLLRRPEVLYSRTRGYLEQGTKQTAVRFLQARERAGRIREGFLAALRDRDLLLAPATPFPAPELEAQRVDVGDGPPHPVHLGGTSWLTRPVNLAGLPALSLPAGQSRTGLPLGIQLIGRPGGEATLLRAGAAFQAATDHHRRAPSP